jgi:biopolymer transport protein ExbB/TolQ
MRLGRTVAVIALALAGSTAGAQGAVDQVARERLAALQARVDRHEDHDRQAAVDQLASVNRAADALSKRLDEMNNLRAQLNEQAATLMTRVEYERRHVELAKDLDALQAKLDKLEGTSMGVIGTVNAIGYGVGVLGTVFGLYAFLTRRRRSS